MDYKAIAEQIISAVGGKENISGLAHCSTRLRIVLADESKVNKEAVENVPAVKGQFSAAGQYQIILGAGTVNTVYGEMSKLLGNVEMSKAELATQAASKQGLLPRLIKGLADIFVPIIPAIVAGGLLMGLANVFYAKDLIFDQVSVIDRYPHLSDLANMINTFANAPFVFLPILLAFSATKKFGGNPYLGAALGMLMVHPELVNGWNFSTEALNGKLPAWEIFGITLDKVGYQGSVLPVLAATYILATLEKFFRKIVPSSLDNLITPLFALFITGFVTFAFVGPITHQMGYWLSDGLTWLYETTGILGSWIFGTFYPAIVITGMHQTFIALETQLIANMATTGGTFIFPIAAMSNVAQGAACLAVFFLTRDSKTKGVALPSGISALLGITEPAMFGVNLRFRYPFYAAMLGSGVASAFIAIFQTKAVALGAAGLPGVISIKPGFVTVYIIGMAISFVVTFAATYFLSLRAKKAEA